jgi:hypothetical protein
LARIAYLVLAHENPKHLARLLDSLSSESSVIFVHIDRKSPADAFAGIRGENVHFARRRFAVHWGDFSVVEATLELLRLGVAYEPPLERFVLVSGADYPLRPAAYIESFFDRHPDAEFIQAVPMPSEAESKPISRLTQYKMRPGASRIAWLLRATMLRAGIAQRERDVRAHLGERTPYGGATWWALSREACEYVLAFVERERRFVRFFRNTHCPDESFFHTILGNSPYRPRLRRELTYADWSAGGPHPAPISDRHLELFQRDPAAPDDAARGEELLFARKFSDQSEDLVARLAEIAGDTRRIR